jgi:hypothetical protein
MTPFAQRQPVRCGLVKLLGAIEQSSCRPARVRASR